MPPGSVWVTPRGQGRGGAGVAVAQMEGEVGGGDAVIPAKHGRGIIT